ncbi:MAG: L-aspartate oxidase, partial [Acidimicrobiales bacterium]
AMRSLLGGGEIGGRTIEVPGPRAPGSVTRATLQRTMTVHAGVLRSAESLRTAAEACAGDVPGDDPAASELRNLATVGRALCAAALAREESRGAHTRLDFPDLRPELELRFVVGG